MVCQEIQSLEKMSHITQLAQLATQPIQLYIAVNFGLEAHKTGVSLCEVEMISHQLQAYPQLDLQGIFVLPPEKLDPELRQRLYTELAAVAQKVGRGRLSLGMSQDLEAAIEAGSTLVRVGTALLGPRTGSDSL